MKKHESPPPIFPLMDVHQVAFLKLHKIETTPTISNNRVVFHVPMTEQVMHLLERFASDELVPVNSFSTYCKGARSAMLALRPPK